MFVIETFNSVWWAFIALVFLICVALWRSLKGKDEAIRQRVLLIIALANVVLLFEHKFVLVELYAYEGFTALEYLPLQLCNINVLLIPLALIIKKRSLYAYLIFVAPITALLALMSPSPEFYGEDFLALKIINFYCTHGILLIVSISFLTLKIIKITYRDVLNSFVILLAMAVLMLIVNIILNVSVYPGANYFYTQGPIVDGGEIGLLKTLWSFIPIPLLYLFPALLVVVPYELLLVALTKKVSGVGKNISENALFYD